MADKKDILISLVADTVEKAVKGKFSKIDIKNLSEILAYAMQVAGGQELFHFRNVRTKPPKFQNSKKKFGPNFFFDFLVAKTIFERKIAESPCQRERQLFCFCSFFR